MPDAEVNPKAYPLADQVLLASHWWIIKILASYWSIFILLGSHSQDPQPGAAGHQLQAAEEGSQRGHQDSQQGPGNLILSSHWKIHLILASHWAILIILASYWSLSIVRVRHPGRGLRAAGDLAAHPSALRGQERALRVRQVQAGPGPRLWGQQTSHRCQVNSH